MWWTNVSLVLPHTVLPHASLCIEDGIITGIVEGDAPSDALNGAGLTVLPGMIDIHGDMLEREILPRPKAHFPVEMGLIEVDKRLASSGVTTAYAAISFAWHKDDRMRSEESARHLIETVNHMRPHLLTDHYVHTRFEITNPDAGLVLKELLLQDQVHLISIMDHTPGQGQYRDIERYIRFSIEWDKITTGEDRSEEWARASIKEAQARPKGWDAVREIARLAREHNVILASHDDDTLDKVAMMENLGVSISEFPVTWHAAEEAKRRNIHVAMGAPNAFRGSSTTEGNLSARQAIQGGVVDTLATDYYPPAMMQAVYALFREGILPLHEAIKLVSDNPADALRLRDRGRIEAGLRADLVFVEETTYPRIRCTLREGTPIYMDRILFDANPKLNPYAQPALSPTS